MLEEVYGAAWLLNRVISCPHVFEILAARLEVISSFELQSAVYFLLESMCVSEGICEFPETEIINIQYYPSEGKCIILLSSGYKLELSNETNEMTFVKSREELEASQTVTYTLMESIREILPEKFRHDFILINLPNLENNFLMDPDTRVAKGSIKILSTDQEIDFEAILVESENTWKPSLMSEVQDNDSSE